MALVRTSPTPTIPKGKDQRPPAGSRGWQRGKVAATTPAAEPPHRGDAAFGRRDKHQKALKGQRSSHATLFSSRTRCANGQEAAQRRHRNAQMTAKDLGSVPFAMHGFAALLRPTAVEPVTSKPHAGRPLSIQSKKKKKKRCAPRSTRRVIEAAIITLQARIPSTAKAKAMQPYAASTHWYPLLFQLY